ncbi:MAG: rRNA maturation RNase YbeY [Phycisphaeraceae bacterium]
MKTDDTDPPLAGWLPGQVARIAALAGVEQGELSLVVVDDARMSALHEQYLGEPATTDVLSFDLREHPDEPLEGDLVLCLDEAARQSAERGHAVGLEVLLYAVHGLLHLLGEDDHDPDSARKMHRREDALLTRAGFGPVFGSL